MNNKYKFGGHQYEKDLGAAHKYYMKVKADYLKKLLKLKNIQKPKLLNVGCGTGEYEELIYDQFHETVSYDPAKKMIEYARSKNIPKTKFFDDKEFIAAKYPKEYFDVITIINVIHHVHGNPEDLFKDVIKYLKKDGYFLIFDHNKNNFYIRYRFKRSKIDQGEKLVSPKKARKMMVNVGLKIKKIDYIEFVPYALRWFNRIEPLLMKVPYGGEYIIISKK